jgi:hypothetical protein
MKILAIGDPHGKLPKNLSSIIKKNKIDVIVCVGDIAPVPSFSENKKTFMQECEKSRKSFKRVVDKLCSFGLPVLTLRGNTWTGSRENDKETNKIFSAHKNLTNKRIGKLRVKDRNFILFDMVYEKHAYRNPKNFTKRIEASQKPWSLKLNKMLKEMKGPIIIAHAPPYGYVDKISSGKHVGSKILLKAIKKYQPPLVLCGHMHEAKGKAKIGKTTVFNLGWHGDYKIIDI